MDRRVPGARLPDFCPVAGSSTPYGQSDRLGNTGTVRVPDGRFGYVADGAVDGYFRAAPTSESLDAGIG